MRTTRPRQVRPAPWARTGWKPAPNDLTPEQRAAAMAAPVKGVSMDHIACEWCGGSFEWAKWWTAGGPAGPIRCPSCGCDEDGHEDASA